MKKASLLFLLVATSLFSFAQAPENEDKIGITNYRIKDGTYSYRSPNLTGGVGTFFDRTSGFNSNSYKQGYLIDTVANQVKMNFRYLEPSGYDPNYSEGYPVILMLHGAVERSNCYNNQCYSHNLTVGTSWRPWQLPPGKTSVPTAPINDANRNNLLNNDHQLLNGGQAHLTARNLANGKKPNDPTLNPRSFPGFIVFPQNLNGWHPIVPTGPAEASGLDVYDAIRIIRLMIEKYNIDPDRIYVHGLSDGGRGTMSALVYADWLFAAALPMSPILNGTSHSFYYQNADARTVPVWIFQGWKDGNPKPSATANTVSELKRLGAGVVRYTVYPSLGHGVWNTAYAEPDFFTWMLGQNKSDLQVEFGMPRVCSTPGVNVATGGARLFMPREMRAFQWEKDGEIIQGESLYVYNAIEPGVYRGRFSRVSSTPTGSEWNQWSKPVEITSSAPPIPTLTHTRSLTLKDINGSDMTVLTAPPGYASYRWERTRIISTNTNLNLMDLMPVTENGYAYTTNSATLIRPCADASCRTSPYNYNVRATDLDGCFSRAAAPKTVWFNDYAPINLPTPSGFTGVLQNSTNALLRWNDDSNNERGYEIWRRRSTDANNAWVLVTITPEDAVLYLDQNLQQGLTYYYKMRAVSDLARSNYAPGNTNAGEAPYVEVTTFSDNIPPTIPQNLEAEIIDTDVDTETCSILISWDASTDAYGVKEYQVDFGASTFTVIAPETTDTIVGVPINSNVAFTVRAIDLNDNMSTPSAQVNIDTRITGLYWLHSTSFYTDLTQIPPYKWKDREYGGKTPNIDISLASQDSYILMKFYGYLYISTEGYYNFKVHHNDGINLFIDGDSIIYYNNYVPFDSITTTVNVANADTFLTAGHHRLEFRYWQSEDDKTLSWEWRGPDAGPLEGEWYPVPAARLKSYDNFDPPAIPAVPTDLTATGSEMDEITLEWSYSGDPAEFEVWRSPNGTNSWIMLGRVASSPFIDQNLVPVTTYYYRIRSVNQYGVSEFTVPAVPGTTLDDVVPPTAPTNLTLISNTLSTASIAWTAATDNLGVAGYDIYVNGIWNSNTTQTYAVVSNLTPQTTPKIYLRAIDTKGNQSVKSDSINVVLAGSLSYYLKPGSTTISNTMNLATWGTNPDGSGSPPTDFNTNGSFFVITRNANISTWNVNGAVSRIIVQDGFTATVTNGGGVQGNVELQGSAALVLPNNTQPTFVSAAPNSVVRYNSTVTQNIQAGSYGHLDLAGSGTKVFPAGVTTINGNLIVGSGVAIAGAPNNGSTIALHGDLIYTDYGTPLFSSSSSAVTLDLKKSGLQTIQFSGTLDLYRIIAPTGTTINLNNGGAASTLSLGSVNGGGLTLPTGSSMFLSNNTLKIIGAGTINSGGETGKIYSSGGSIEITSSSNSNSNLHFDPPNRLLANLNVNLSGSGVVNVNDPVDVSDGIKIDAGDVLSNGNVRLLSTALKTANLHEIELDGQILGDVRVQRYMSPKTRTYRYISSSVDGVTIADWQNFFPITGDFPESSTGAGLGTAASLFVLTSSGTWQGYPDDDFFPVPYRNAAAPIEAGKGYAAFIRNTTLINMETIGNPFQGPVAFTDLYPAGAGFEGWNLVGNPYASAIRWNFDNPDAWTNKNDISNIVAVRNNFNTSTGQFLYYDGVTGAGTYNGQGEPLTNGLIAPGQAFYVLATGPNPTLTINEPAKFNGQQSLFRERTLSDLSHLYINLKRGGLLDQAVVAFTSFGTDDFDAEFDAAKIVNDGMFSFSTLTRNGKATAINNMSNTFCDKSISLNIEKATAGDYLLEFPDVTSLHGVGSIQLVDNLLGKTIDLSEVNEYAFSVTSDPLTIGANRFEIVINRPDLDRGVVVSASSLCAEPGKVTLSNTQKGASYWIMDSEGNEVSPRQTSVGNDLGLNVITGYLKDGVNQLIVKAGFDGCSSVALTETANVEFYNAPILEAPDFSVCLGSSGKVSVSTLSQSVVSYNWYDSENTKIKGFDTNEMETSPILEETLFSVAAVFKNGCEGPRQGVLIYPLELDEPELIFSNDTLFTNVAAEVYEWKLNGIIVNSTTGNFITGLKTGVYELTCKNGGCEKISRPFNVTGNEGNVDMSVQYQLFPNPTSSQNINLKVTGPSKEDVMVKVIDVLGKEHYINTFSADEVRNTVKIQPANNFRAGVYYMIIRQDARLKEIKFIIGE